MPRSFTYTCAFIHEWNEQFLPSLSQRYWSSFTDPEGMKGRVSLGTAMASKQSAQDRYVTAITVVSCANRHASLGNWSTGSERRTHDLLCLKSDASQ